MLETARNDGRAASLGPRHRWVYGAGRGFLLLYAPWYPPLASGGLWFNVQQRQREQKLANERAQGEALQAYLDRMSQLLADKERPYAEHAQATA